MLWTNYNYFVQMCVIGCDPLISLGESEGDIDDLLVEFYIIITLLAVTRMKISMLIYFVSILNSFTDKLKLANLIYIFKTIF